MSTTDGSRTLEKALDPSSHFYLSSSDNHTTPLVPTLLTGDNYATWVRAAKRALNVKDKMSFVDGTIKKPETTDSDFKPWNKCNNMVASWIYHSLDKTLQASMPFVEDAEAMWKELRDRYSRGNAQRIHQLKKELCRMEQGDDSVVTYYVKMKTCWEELDQYSDLPRCTCDAAAVLAQKNEVEKLHQFLMGLDQDNYSVICTQILNMDPLPNSQQHACAFLLFFS